MEALKNSVGGIRGRDGVKIRQFATNIVRCLNEIESEIDALKCAQADAAAARCEIFSRLTALEQQSCKPEDCPPPPEDCPPESAARPPSPEPEAQPPARPPSPERKTESCNPEPENQPAPISLATAGAGAGIGSDFADDARDAGSVAVEENLAEQIRATEEALIALDGVNDNKVATLARGAEQKKRLVLELIRLQTARERASLE